MVSLSAPDSNITRPNYDYSADGSSNNYRPVYDTYKDGNVKYDPSYRPTIGSDDRNYQPSSSNYTPIDNTYQATPQNLMNVDPTYRGPSLNTDPSYRAPIDDLNYRSPSLNADPNYRSPISNIDPNYRAPSNDYNYRAPSSTTDLDYRTPTNDYNYKSPTLNTDPSYRSPTLNTDANYRSPTLNTDPNYKSPTLNTDLNYKSPTLNTDPNYKSPTLNTDPNYKSPTLNTDPNYRTPTVYADPNYRSSSGDYNYRTPSSNIDPNYRTTTIGPDDNLNNKNKKSWFKPKTGPTKPSADLNIPITNFSSNYDQSIKPIKPAGIQYKQEATNPKFVFGKNKVPTTTYHSTNGPSNNNNLSSSRVNADSPDLRAPNLNTNNKKVNVKSPSMFFDHKGVNMSSAPSNTRHDYQAPTNQPTYEVPATSTRSPNVNASAPVTHSPDLMQPNLTANKNANLNVIRPLLNFQNQGIDVKPSMPAYTQPPLYEVPVSSGRAPNQQSTAPRPQAVQDPDLRFPNLNSGPLGNIREPPLNFLFNNVNMPNPSYKPPVTSYQPPANSYEPPITPYQPPVTYQPPPTYYEPTPPTFQEPPLIRNDTPITASPPQRLNYEPIRNSITDVRMPFMTEVPPFNNGNAIKLDTDFARFRNPKFELDLLQDMQSIPKQNIFSMGLEKNNVAEVGLRNNNSEWTSYNQFAYREDLQDISSVIIANQNKEYLLFLNNKLLTRYESKQNPQNATHLKLDGDPVVQKVDFIKFNKDEYSFRDGNSECKTM